MSNTTLKPLGPGEVYVSISEDERKRLLGYSTSPDVFNWFVLHMIVEPINATDSVLVFFAQGNKQQIVSREMVRIFNKETGEFLSAWKA